LLLNIAKRRLLLPQKNTPERVTASGAKHLNKVKTTRSGEGVLLACAKRIIGFPGFE